MRDGVGRTPGCARLRSGYANMRWVTGDLQAIEGNIVRFLLNMWFIVLA